MTLHLIKLCVGADSVDDLLSWQKQRLADMRRRGVEVMLRHTTRQMPRRRDEVLDGGSLYWVIKGEIACRQRVIDLRGRVDDDGIERCDICLDSLTVRVDPRPRGPFQGWRYFTADDAPADLAAGAGEADKFPDHLRRELRTLGVL